MPTVLYEAWTPRPETARLLVQAEAIATDYANQGYDLTLRQLYYQFVARDLLANTQQSYKRLGDIVQKGRYAGFIDWDHIVDRTRNLQSLSHWDSPNQIVDAVAKQFRMDKWEGQPTRIEVWVEKEALAGVIGRSAEESDCSWFACRGYPSASEVWKAAQRLRAFIEAGQNVIVLHLGDHDPSGIDMTRDIRRRLTQFICQDYFNDHRDEFAEGETTYGAIQNKMAERCGGRGWLTVDRIALNFDQVEEYNPPPNPAKQTDSRYADYLERYGDESWELDALDPATLDALIGEAIQAHVDPETWGERVDEEGRHRERLQAASDRWEEIVELLDQEAS